MLPRRKVLRNYDDNCEEEKFFKPQKKGANKMKRGDETKDLRVLLMYAELSFPRFEFPEGTMVRVG